MKKMKRVALVSTAILVGAAGANQLILPECISRSKPVGTEQGESFSDETQLTDSITSNMRFYAYQECNDEQGRFTSFTIVLADEME